ncbi:hypothetical protein CUMW_195860 [Citrus unshiu]|nr:hypothetical protein CUMW_195860 [Citrus unshiu]
MALSPAFSFPAFPFLTADSSHRVKPLPLLRKVSPLALELFDRSMRRGLYCKSQSHRADYALQKKKKEVAAPEEVAFPQLTLFQVCFLPWH